MPQNYLSQNQAALSSNRLGINGDTICAPTAPMLMVQKTSVFLIAPSQNNLWKGPHSKHAGLVANGAAVKMTFKAPRLSTNFQIVKDHTGDRDRQIPKQIRKDREAIQ